MTIAVRFEKNGLGLADNTAQRRCLGVHIGQLAGKWHFHAFRTHALNRK
jgi:hypothetical protein